MKKILFLVTFTTCAFSQTPLLLGSSWVRLGAGVEFYGNDESDPVVESSLNIPLVDQIDFRLDFDLHFGDDVMFEAFPGAVFNISSLLKDPEGVNPYLRAGVLVRNHDGRDDKLGWHAGIGTGAEIPIGPSVTIDPHLMAYVIDASSVMLGIDGGYWLNPQMQVALDFDWNGDEYYRTGGDFTYRF